MSEQELKQAILKARPKLSQIAPLTYSICWGYAIMNLVLGAGMYVLYRPSIQGQAAPISIADILSYQIWGFLFFALGVVTVFTLITNHWKATRQFQLVGLLFKAVWAIALLIRCFQEPQTILITSVWLLIAYVQAMVYIYFLPIPKADYHGRQ